MQGCSFVKKKKQKKKSILQKFLVSPMITLDKCTFLLPTGDLQTFTYRMEMESCGYCHVCLQFHFTTGSFCRFCTKVMDISCVAITD